MSRFIRNISSQLKEKYMTYIHEYEVQNDTVKVEYCFSSVTDSIKVVDMWVNGKFHRVNWMSHEGREKLMTRLEQDLENRLCGTFDDDSMIEPFMKTLNYHQVPLEQEVMTEVDLDRDIPAWGMV